MLTESFLENQNEMTFWKLKCSRNHSEHYTFYWLKILPTHDLTNHLNNGFYPWLLSPQSLTSFLISTCNCHFTQFWITSISLLDTLQITFHEVNHFSSSATYIPEHHLVTDDEKWAHGIENASNFFTNSYILTHIVINCHTSSCCVMNWQGCVLQIGRSRHWKVF